MCRQCSIRYKYLLVKYQAPFTLEIYFKIRFQNVSFESKHFHIGNKLSKANIVNALLDVCKHWLTDQSQRSVSEISSAKFRKIEHVLNCEIKFSCERN